MVFSATGTGIVEQTRKLMRVDSNQWPTVNISNSCNNWLDFIAGYAIGADKRFQWDDTNHTDLPEGTIDSVANQSDYSFLTDENGNNIVTLLGVARLENGVYVPLTEVDRNDPDYDAKNFGTTNGTPTKYDKIADNIVRLNYRTGSVVSDYLKFFFQRTPSYFSSSDTTKRSGFSPLLDRGFVIASAYDGALTLGLPNLQALLIDREKEEQKVVQYFADRNQDLRGRLTPSRDSNR